MAVQIIPADAHLTRKVFKKKGNEYLSISEFFYDSIQGEGIYLGHPASFLRLQGCTLNCSFCDSREVWRHGSQYSFDEIFTLIDSFDIRENFYNGQHLVITGGSPLLQQDRLIQFIRKFIEQYGFKPFIEIENEAVLFPESALAEYVDCWNNSPKLVNSGMPAGKRYQKDVLWGLGRLKNSWFKFVVSHEDEWKEISEFYLKPGLIRKDQIILMPEGATPENLETNRETVINMAIEHDVRYSTREHILVWKGRIGV